MSKCSISWKLPVFGVILVRIFPYSDWIPRDTPYLSVWSPNLGKYFVSLRIQSEFGKIRTRITPNTDTFYAVFVKQVKVREDLQLSLLLLFVLFCDSWMWCEKKTQIEKVMVFMFVLSPTQNVFKVITNNFSR